MDELIDAMQRQAGISGDEAHNPVAAMLALFNAELPSPLMSHIPAMLDHSEPRTSDDNGRT